MSKQSSKASLLGIVMFLFASTLAAQVTEEWVARYDGPASYRDIAYAMAIDDAGNVYVTGESDGSETYQDYATIKYNSSGTEQWVARYDGPASGNDGACAIGIDGAGNVYVTGSSEGSGTRSDYATVKYSPSGTEQWVARYDGPTSYEDEARAMAIDGAGNVYVTGQSACSETGWDYATVKYNTSGTEQWVARYDAAINYDAACAIATDGAGNVYVTGRSVCSETYWDYATVKYNTSGTEQWVARYDAASSYDVVYAIAIDDAGNVYVTGRSEDSGTYQDYATVKYNSSGTEQWVARYDAAIDWDKAFAIAVDGAGNVYVTGESGCSETGYNYATVKYSSSGAEQWVARYDGPRSGEDLAYAIAVDGAGNVYVTGRSSWPNSDYATIKYSQGPGVAEASPDVSSNRLEITQLIPQPVITYTLPSSSSISLKIYDVTGKLVRTLVTGSQEAGTRIVTWDGRDRSGQLVSSGLYFIRIATPEFSRTAKVIIVH